MKVFGEDRINTYFSNSQSAPVIAALSGGGHVVAWVSYGQDGSVEGIYAQRLDANGIGVGPEFRVNTTLGNDQTDPAIAALSDGGFVVVWSDDGSADGSGWGVFAQRFDAAGVAQGAQFKINSTTSSTQYQPSVAAYNGGFVVTWSNHANDVDTSGYGIFGSRYDNAGNLVQTGGQNEFQVNTYTTNHQYESDLAAYADGSFVVVWRSEGQEGDGYSGVYAQRYDSSGAKVGAEFHVNTYITNYQYEPRVATLSDGGFVVVWSSRAQDGSSEGVYGQRYDASGNPAGGEFQVNVGTDYDQAQPDVTGLSTGGFVVTWYSYFVPAESKYYEIYTREYDATGTPVGGEQKVNTYDNSSNQQIQPAIADLGQGNYAVVWSSYSQDGSEFGIYQQLFGDPADFSRQANPVLGDFSGTVTFGENAVNAGLQVLDAAVSLTDSDSADFAGGKIELFYVKAGSAEDQLGVRNQGNAPGEIGVSGNTVSYGGASIGTLSGGTNGANLSIDLNGGASLSAVEALIQNLGYGNSSSSPTASRQLGIRVSDGDGGSTIGGVITVNVTRETDGTPKAYGEDQVNTYTYDYQHDPEVAALADGGYVVVWTSRSQDGVSDADGVYAQRYSASGVAVGPEIRVPGLTSATQDYAHVAGLSDGGFVITWEDSAGYDGSGWGVYGQRYDAGSVAQGGQFLVNTYTSSTQHHDAVASYAGGFAVAWSSYGNPGGDGYDIYLRRFNNDGTALDAGELRVSTTPGNPADAQDSTQYVPDIAALSDGDLLVVWRDDGGNDGSSHGVYARRFDVGTGTFGDTFLVNTGNTSGSQYEPKVAALNDGGYVIVWRDDNQDGSSAAVMGQRYDSAGNAVGGQFRVNEYTTGGQYEPDVIGLSSGGFVVSFYNDNIGPDGTYDNVHIREYDAAGNPVDGDRLVNSTTSSAQHQPAMADLGQGNYVVVWRSDSQDGSNSGVYQQLFGDSAELPRQANPTLADFTGTTTFDENTVNAGLQVIDAAVSLNDSDSANFNGGRLDLYYLTGQAAEDQLGVVHQGSGAGQIGVSGNTVSYGGVAIGTISGGANGASLRIDFTSDAATAGAVEALIQRLGYANPDSSPNASRTLGLRVSDGDGGSSTPNVLTINVTAQLDGTPKAYGEDQVHTYTPDHQQTPNVATLADGGYVVTWASNAQDGSSWGVYAQRYTASGVAVGPEFKVNSLAGGEQSWPHVAGLSDGGFVIAWQDNGNDASGYGVYGQRYDAAGAAQGAQFLINTTTSNSQYHDAVAAYTGGFATVWSSTQSGGSSYDIYLQRWDNAGNKLLTDGQNELRISTNPGTSTAQSGGQYVPEVAAQANGNLFVVWTDSGGNDGAADGIYGRFYNAGSATFGDTVLVNATTSGSQGNGGNGDYEPNVAALSDGGFIVVWPSNANDGSGWAVMGQRLDASGNKVGGEFQINENSANNQYQIDVIGLSTGGFVVGFYHDNISPDGTYYDAYIREFDSSGVPIDGERKVNTYNGSNYYQGEPALADLGNGNYVVTWTSQYQDGSGSSYGIYQQLFGATAELPRQANPDLADFVGTVTFNENDVNAGLQVIDAAVSLIDSDSVNFNGGRLDLYYLTGQAAEDQLGVVHQGNGAGQIGVSGNTVSYGGTAFGTISGGGNGVNLRIDFTSDTATPDAVEALIQRLGYANSDSFSPNASRTLGLRVSDGDGGSSTANVLTINVTPQDDGGSAKAYGEEQVNTYTPSTQDMPAIASLSGGGYVVAWDSSAQDGAGDGVYAQRFTSGGVAIGPEFRVNTTTTGAQNDPTIVGLSNGGFVVAWTSPDASVTGIYAQRYDASGVAQGSEFLVNTASTSGTQTEPVVSAYAGGFVVGWSSNASLALGGDGSGYGIYGQHYLNDGTTNGASFRVNTTTLSDQSQSDVATSAAGGVVVWTSYNQDAASTNGIYAQRYAANGAPLGGEFMVNTLTAGNQVEPHVAMLSDGGFVVVWTDQSGVDGSSHGVYGQRYDSAGIAQGGQFLINESTTGGQYQPDVTGLSSGGFVVTWYNDNYDLTGAGTTSDVYIREYDATGNAIDGQRKLDSGSNSTEYQPAIADLGNGNFAVVYADYNTTANGGNNTYEIHQQLFGDTVELARPSANPVLDDVIATRTLGAAQAITPQLIDADVWVSDSDSTDFGGGSLWVYFTSGQLALDVLGVNNEGTGAGQIGVSGGDISYGGVVIGGVAGGGGGAPLVISFNTNATPEAVRQLTENLTYQYNDVSAPNGSRTVAFRLFDGDGGASLPASTTVTIQAANPAAALSLTDLETSVTLSEAAAQLGVVMDENVSVTQGANPITTLTVSYVSSSGRPEDQLSIRHQGTGAEQVGVSGGDISYEGTVIGAINVADNGINGDQLVIDFNASATAQAVERVIENLRYQTTSDGPLANRTIQVQVKDSANATSQSQVIYIIPEDEGVQPLTSDEQVNTYEPNDQYYPRVVGLEGPNAGSYVVVWQSNGQDGSGYGIHAQRYNAQGVQVGTEFQVNTYASNTQTEPMVASLANGGFLIVWRSEGQDGSSGGVYAQRFGADGAPAGGEFQVSTAVTQYDQTHPTALGLADGSFIIAWADQYRDTNAYGSYAQRYAADGTPLGADFLINTYLPSNQYVPYLAALKDDPGTVGTDEAGFVAVWDSTGQDGGGRGVYAQRFDLTGAKVGSEFRVNTNTASDQKNPDVAVLANSHIVVVWHDSSNSSIRGQLYTAGGVSIGAEFTVSTSDFDSTYGDWPHVTALGNGGFVVSWDGHSSPSDSGYGVYAQEFDASGNKVDAPFSLNSNTANNQHYPDIAALTGNNFVAAWMSNYQETDGNSSHGIFQRLFGTPGSVTRQANPELIDLETTASFNENDVNVAQLLDPGVRVVDSDSANFDGGRMQVSVISGYGAAQAFDPAAYQQDHFSLRDQGGGAGQVGYNAGTGVVSYGGAAIGTIISNGQNGADLMVQFNSSATAEAVEAVIENLTYRNSASNPTASRQVSVVVSDGDGGQSAPRTMTINVAAQTDGAVALLGEDQRVNTYTASNQEVPIVAALEGVNDGQYVIIWQSYGQDSDNWGVFGQRYDVNGSAIGPEFQINTTTPGAQDGYSLMSVAALSTGGFVVAWDHDDGSNDGVYAQRYGADGQPVGGEFLVNTSTNYSHQFQPAVLGLNGGAFVIAYTDYSNADGDSYGVRVQHYDAAGVAQGAPLTVNTYVSGNQSFAQLAKLNDGGYVVVWHSQYQDGDNWSVQARLMNADGTPRSAEFQVNTYTPGDQSNADVAVLAGGDFVVSWLSNNSGLGGWSTMAQRFSAAGVKIGGEVLVNDGNTAPSNGDTYSRITALDNGGYVVTWSDSSGVNGHDAYAQLFDAAGNKVDAPLLLNQYTSSTQYRPDVAGLTGDRWVATWQSYGQDGDVYGIYQNLFGPAGSFSRSAAPVISDLAPSLTVPENTANAAAGVLMDASVSVTDVDSGNFDGGRLIVSVISGYNSLGTDLSQNLPLQDHFSVRDQGGGAGQVGVSGSTVSYGGTAVGVIDAVFNGQNGVDLVIQFNASASAETVEAVIENLIYRNSSSDPVASRTVSVTVSDGDGATSAPRTVQINVTPEADGAIPLFDAEQVNTYTTSTQNVPAMAKLSDGGYVTLWQSDGQDGWGYGIFGQRFAADGTRVGNEFRVSDYTPYNQTEVDVAGLNDGGFVAVYRGQYRDASGDAVIGQRFDASGARVGGEFLVNTSSGGTQYQPSITALADGGFAVAWYSDGLRDGEYYDVFFQRYDAAGQAVGLETRANTAISGNIYAAQYEPHIIQLTTGDILVAWRSDGQDGSSSGVYAQRFSSAGVAIGGEFQLNVYTNNEQSDPQLTATASGFVAVWTSYDQDGSYYGVYARLYDNSGNPTSAEFRVSETSYHYQMEPTVATLANGGFAVAWRSYNGSTGYYDINSQQFDALGNRIDGELKLDVTINHDYQPVVVGLNNGNFVVSWYGGSDANGDAIFQRIVGNPADFPRQTAPTIVDLVSSVTFLENQINDAPQLIDPGIGLLDPDSTNFAGGRLDVSYVTPYGTPDQFDIPGINAQDQLGIRNEGAGVDQIGVSGSDVTYNFGSGPVVIGSILSDGVNGKPLTVIFNANATPEAAEALVENLTYQNFLSNPEPTRTVSLSLSDGDGGVTAPKAITINITAQPDGAVPFGAEKVVNTTLPGTQEAPAIAYLSNDSYVVVWQDTSGQDSSGYGVFARIYDSNDNPLGDQFQINTTTASTQYQPTVIALEGGGFTVAWTGYQQISASSGYDIVGRTFANDGTPAGAEFVINNPAATYVNYGQSLPDLAALQNGGFVAVWYAEYDESNNSYTQIWGQRFDSAGAKVGGVFHVNTSAGFEGDHQEDPSVDTLADGRFVVVWRSDSQDGSSAGVYGQRFNADGTPDGAEFRVNTYTANGQYQQKVAALNDGGYVVVWGSDSGQDTSGWGVYGQRYDATGAAVGGEFRVNYTVSSTQYQPAVASLENGGFVVSWADGDEIWLQQYDSSGRKVDSQQSVNADGNYGYSNTPDLVSTPDGGFIVTYGGYNYGNSSYDVFLQRFSNTAPTIQDVSVVGPEDSAIILTDELFASGFFDAEGQALAAIKVITLPASGILKLDGIDVVAGQVISVADLAANKLTYQGNLDFNGPDQFRWNGSDGNVFATTSVFTNITVNNVNDAPALEAGIDGTASEGIHFVRAITIGDPDSTDTHLVTVSWLGSGGQTGSYQFNTSAGTPSIGLTLPDDASYTVTVTANDQQGQANSIETDSFTVTVNNVAPTLPYMSGNNTVEQGQIYTLDLNGPYDYLASPVVDPGTDTVTEYRIDWGDGTAVETILAASLPANGEVTHTYAAPGTPTIHVAVVDEDGTHADAGTKSITVTPPAEVIVVDAGADAGASEGTLFSRTISFTDPADQDPAGRDVTVDWGDGTAAQNFRIATGQTSFDIQHVFADNRVTPYTVNVTVDDDGAQQDSDSFDVTVGDVAPTLFLGGNGSTPEGSAYTLTLGGVVDPGADTVSEYVVHWGDGNDQSFLVADLPANRQVQHVYNDGDVSGTDHTITVDLVNEDGTFLAAGSKPITVTNVAPSVPVSGADSTDEGATYVLTVGALTDPGLDTPTLYRINWGDGGATDDYTPAQYAALLLAGGAVSHIFADGNAGGTARNIVLQVLDEDGTHNAGGKSITVNNVAPTLALTGAASVDEGASYTLNLGAITDPGQDTVSSYAIDWGDGSPPEVLSAAQVASQSGTATHTYADGASTPTISVDLTDEDGTHLAAGSLSIAVNNVAPTIALTGAGGIDEGSVYTLTLGALVDPGTETPTSYRIDWGDGTVHNYTPAEYAALSGSTTHTYADGAATPTITVSVTDEDGTHVAGSKAITVNNVAPSAAVSGAATVDEGSAYTLTVGNVTEPGADTRTGYSIDWGDGTIDNFDPTQWATAAGNFSHTYADGGAGGTARNITVSATDEDGTFILGSKAVTVNNAAPSVVLSGNAATDEGSVYTLNLLGGDPAGANDTLSYSIDWGDGSASQNLTAAELAALSGNVAHTFVDDEDGFTNATARTVEVTVSDEDGGSTLQSKSVTVNNVAPTALLGGADSVLENTLYTLNVGAILEPGTDTRDYYEIDWGDGITQSFDEAFFQLHNGVFEHLYGPGGAVRTITMTTQDEDGEFTLGTKQVTVTLATPNLSFDAGVDTSLNEGDTFTRSIAFSDGTDNGAAGWSYSIDYGDGSAVVNGTTLVQSVDLSHLYADGAASRTVTLSLIDEAGETASDSFVVTVNNVAPTIALTGADSVNEGASYTLTLGAMTDPGTDTVTSYVVNWGDGSSDTYGAAGDVTHVYADGAATPTITVDLVDEDGTHTAAGSKAITVNNVTPLIALSGASSVDEGAAYTLTLGAVTDPGTDTVTSYVVNWGDGSSDTYAAAGDVTHVYADGLSTPTITVDLVDEDGTHVGAGSKSISVNNVAPTVALTGADNVNEGALYTLNLGAVTDPGDDTVSSYVVNWGDGSSDTYAAGGDVTHVYADGVIIPTIAVHLVDEDGTHIAAGSKTITINNVAPSITVSGADSVIEDTSYTLNLGAVSDPGDDTVNSYVVHWGDGSSDTYGAGGNVTHTYADPGNYGIIVDLVDEDGTFNNAGSKSVLVNASGGGNTPPVADDESYSVHAGQTLSIAAPGILDGDTDADGDPLSVSVVNITGLQGTLNPATDGSFSFTPTAGFVGTTSFTYTVSDGNGGFDTATVNIDVTNAAPVADDETYDMRPGQTLSIAAPGLLDGDTDADGDPLSVSVVNITGLQGTLNPAVNGSFSFTPTAGFTGATGFSYTVSDGLGGFDTAQVTINVVNSAPVADDESYSVHAGQTLSIAAPGILDGDTDADGDPLSVSVVNITGLQGTLNPAANGGFDFTPTAGYTGTTSFTYTVSDGFGGFDTATVNIDVTNAAPVADDETYDMRPGQTLSIAAPGLLDGDTDADGDPLSVSVVNITGLQGTLNPAVNGSFSFTPTAGFTGATGFSYTVSDGLGGFDTAQVTINVVNSAPVADDESYSVHAGQTLSIAAPGILDGDTDADGDPLSVSVVNITGLQGTLNPAANGGFDFTPTAGFVGTTSFTYTVVDGVGGSDTGTVTVDVTAAHTIARLGDAPARLTSSDPNAWINAWTESGVSISHKAVYSNAGEAWSAVTLNGLGSTTLPGGDLFAGDLGVSGQTLATSTTRQEIDGTEALRFNLTQEATKVTVDLSRFYLDDDANVFNYNEAGRLQAFDDQGNVVGEALFHADQSAGGHLVTLEVANGFTSVVLTAGAYDLNHDFVFGAYADDAGGFATAPYGTHGSDFLVNAIEFELPVIGVNPDPG